MGRNQAYSFWLGGRRVDVGKLNLFDLLLTWFGVQQLIYIEGSLRNKRCAL